MYVAQHGGMIGNDKIIAAKIAELVSELKDDGESFEGSLVFTANYDPPFRLQHRHNEIWIAAARENVMHTIA